MELATPKTNFACLEKVVSAGVDSPLLQPPPFGTGVLDVTGFLHLVALILVAVLCEVQRRGTLPSALFCFVCQRLSLSSSRRQECATDLALPSSTGLGISSLASSHFGTTVVRRLCHICALWSSRARQSYVYIELFASVSRLENLPCHPSAYGDVDLQERLRWIWPRSASAFASRIAESVGSPSLIVGRVRALSTEGDWASDQTPTARAIAPRQSFADGVRVVRRLLTSTQIRVQSELTDAFEIDWSHMCGACGFGQLSALGACAASSMQYESFEGYAWRMSS